MIEIVRSNGKYLIFKLYESENLKFARVVSQADSLFEAKILAEDMMPATNVSGGAIAGMDIGLSKKKKYREHYALKNVNLEVYKGETVGIIGTNGSGKSTILKIRIDGYHPGYDTVINLFKFHLVLL